MKRKHSLTLVLLLFQLLFFSCMQDEEFPNLDLPPIPESTIVADAGHDQTIYLPRDSTYLDGSHSSFTGSIIKSYSWTKVSGPDTFLVKDTTAVRTLLSKLVKGVYKFELKVTNEVGNSSKDTVQVVVVGGPTEDTTVSPNWSLVGYLPADDFFFGPRYLFNGSNFLMEAGNRLFAISNKGVVGELTEANTWKPIGEFPEQMNRAPVVFSANGKAYCLGEGHLWQYYPSDNSWQRKNDVPSSIEQAQLAMVIQGKAILFGSGTQVIEYDPATDAYTTKSNFPGERLATGFEINGKGLGVGADGRCWEFSPETNSWQEKASMVSGILHMSGFSLNGYGYVIGDLHHTSYNESQPMKIWRFDPNANQWQRVSKDYPGYGAYEINAISMGNRVYVGLGYNNGDFNALDLWLVE